MTIRQLDHTALRSVPTNCEIGPQNTHLQNMGPVIGEDVETVLREASTKTQMFTICRRCCATDICRLGYHYYQQFLLDSRKPVYFARSQCRGRQLTVTAQSSPSPLTRPFMIQ